MLERMVIGFESICERMGELGPSGYTFCLDLLGIFPGVLHSTYPDEWQTHYSKSRYALFDPVMLWVATHTGVTRWSDIPTGMFSRSGDRVFEKAREFGIVHGAVAVRRSDKAFRKHVLTVARRDAPYSDEELVEIEQILERVVDGFSTSVHLSPDEVECLILAANGRTHDEISAELSISKDTVKKRLERARSKIGASNIAHAIAVGFSMGIIRQSDLR